MKLSGIFNLIALVAVAVGIFLFPSCRGGDQDRSLDIAESLVWTRPDSSLSVLRSIDTLELRKRSRRARYSLLYAMALDRNLIDTADLLIIEPAVKYYERHGPESRRMMTFYYLGRLHYNAGDYLSAVRCYMRAREYSSDSEDLVFKGLIASAVSDVYAQNNNLTEKISFSEEAVDCFVKAGDERRAWITTGRLASYYADRKDWKMEDSLYSVFFSRPPLDSSVLAEHFLNAARYNLVRPDSDPSLSVGLFRKAVNECGARPSLVDYCAYAYSSELSGDRKTADEVMAQLDAIGCDSGSLSVWKYRVFKHQGDLGKALGMLERAFLSQESAVVASLNQSVSQAQSDYFEAKSELMEKDRRMRIMSRWIVALACLIVVSAVVAVSVRSGRKWRRRVAEVSLINEDVERRLSREMDASSYKDIALRNLRKKYVQTYKKQYRQLNDLCVEYLETVGSGKEKERIYAKVKRIVSLIDSCNQRKLEQMIDENLDGIMEKLHKDLPDAPDNDFRFIALNILGFDAKTIARIMGYTVQSVYTKRVRLRARIASLSSENTEFYLEFIG